MAEGQSRYVKLTRDRGQLQEITPGELNQPIEVPQVTHPFWFRAVDVLLLIFSLRFVMIF